MAYTLTLADDPYLAVLTPPPGSLPASDRARFALHYAVLAPSVHNTQPWRFRVRDDPAGTSIELLADLGRDLPALDADHRQLIISCGAALGALRAALAQLGLDAAVSLLPDAATPRLLARITVSGNGRPPTGGTAALGALTPQLRARRTYRGPMTADEPTTEQRQRLDAEAATEGATLTWVATPADRLALEHMVALAALEEAELGAVEAELRLWSSRDPRARDGVPPGNWQRSSLQAVLAPVVQRDFALGRPISGRDERPSISLDPVEEATPALAVLCTGEDGPRAWLAAGQALIRVLLRAQECGLAVGYLNQPTEVADVRAALATHIGHLLGVPHLQPQLVLRVGHAAQPEPPATPRRRVSQVLQR